MSEVLAQLTEIRDQEAFNLERWSEIESDPFLASLEHRIETNRHGQIVMMPPPGFEHSRLQSSVLATLMSLLGVRGRVLAECPVSTFGGVKGVDVVWVSDVRITKGLRRNVLTIAPEICVEVLFSGNTRAEIEEKRRLYFEAGRRRCGSCRLPEGSPSLERRENLRLQASVRHFRRKSDGDSGARRGWVCRNLFRESACGLIDFPPRNPKLCPPS